MLAIALLTRGDNAVERHLAHDQEDDQSHGGPYYALLEGDLGLGDLDLGDERGEWLDQVEETDCVGGLSAVVLGIAFERAIGALVSCWCWCCLSSVVIRTAAHDDWMWAPRCAPVTPGDEREGFIASRRAAIGVEKRSGWWC